VACGTITTAEILVGDSLGGNGEGEEDGEEEEEAEGND
jgi:hypothetical protein